MRWDSTTGYWLRKEHLERIVASARYFGFLMDCDALVHALEVTQANLPLVPHRVRLLLDEAGEIQIETVPLKPNPPTVSLGIATTGVDPADPFLTHKTTHRVIYERASQECPEVDDVLLWNTRGEITETTTANVVVEWNGEKITPPVTAGLLAGTYRRKLLEEGIIRESCLRLDDLSRVQTIWLINSVRGWRRAVLVSPIPT